ncbi:hypothetical protein SK128_003141 [Halocaridina rubra]|uniref:Uncharacterized protein n=1 Tax=Halocaridina rubra TaxID=373956 RepID=A0AAN8X4U6_HALRR
MFARNSAMSLLVSFLVLSISTWPSVHGFNVGLKGTKCNLDPAKGEINDPCKSLYDGVCTGSHCACPAGMHEDSALKRCVPGEAPKKSSSGTQAGGGVDLFDDLPFDYEPPGKKTTPKPSAPVVPPPQRPPPQPQPGYPGQPQPQPGYPGQPLPQPGYPGQPQPQPGYPAQPGQYPPGQPGQYPPGQPGQYPPGHYPPGQYPGQSGGSFRPTQKPGRKSGGDNVGEKAGGGVGGIVGLLIIGGLIYFCCCRGGKGKEMMNKFGGGKIPFIGGRGGPGAGVPMQQSMPMQQDPNFDVSQAYVPPGGDPNAGPYPPPQQPYPPPAALYMHGLPTEKGARPYVCNIRLNEGD